VELKLLIAFNSLSNMMFVKELKLYGLGHFRYMTILVRRGGQFWHVTTLVHMRSILVCVFFGIRVQCMLCTILIRH